MLKLSALENALRNRNRTVLNELFQQHFANDINYAWCQSVLDWLFGNASLIIPFRIDTRKSVDAQARETLSCDHVYKLLKFNLSGNSIAALNHIRIGREYDCLGDRFEPNSWGVAMTLNYIMLQQITPSRSVAVVVTMRDDGLSMLEWIAHYRVQKFDRIFVFSNNNEDFSDIMLQELASQDVITYIEQDTDLVVSPQLRAFEYSIHFMVTLRDFEWVFYLDSDEFLVLDSQYEHSIKTFLTAVCRSSTTRLPSAILFKWLWYISGYRFAWEAEMLLKRFQHATEHGLYKSLVRLTDLVSMRWVHFPETKEARVVLDAELNRILEDNIWPHRGSDAGGRLNHYWCKSFQEFVGKKRRGDSITGQTRTAYSRDFDLFFVWNCVESPENLAVPPYSLIVLVEAELEKIRGLPNIREIEEKCKDKYFSIITEFVADDSLYGLYEKLSTKLNAR